MVKKITLLMFAFMLTVSLSAQVAFEEDFSGTTSGGLGSLTDIGWTVHNADGKSANGSLSFLNEAWKIVNLQELGLSGPNVTEGIMSTSWLSPAGQADRWAVTPQITVPQGSPVLMFDVWAIDPSYPDGYEVWVSTSGNTPSDFTGSPVYSESQGPTGGYHTRTVSMESYAGQNVYIAFRNNSNDQYLLAMDNISVKTILENDVAVTDINFDVYNLIGSNPVGVDIKNMGGNTVSSATVSWTVGSETHSTNLSNMNLSAGQTKSFTLDTPYEATSTGEKTITVEVSSVNGGADANPTDNSLTKSVYFISHKPAKHVVIEEGTGTWCGWCPRGFVAMEYMYDNPGQFPYFIGIGVHYGDPMEVSGYTSEVYNQVGGGFPGSVVDRVEYPVSVTLNEWTNQYNNRKNIIAPGQVEMTGDYNPSTRGLTVSVNTRFYMDMSNADYRVSVVVVEDGVTGTGNGWGQENYYAGGSAGPMGGWENLPATVHNYEYNRTARATIGGYHGQAGSVPSQITDGALNAYEMTYTFPSHINPDNVTLVALILDNSTGEIINGRETPLSNLSVENVEVKNNFKLYPNPAADVVNVSFNEQMSGEVAMDIYNMAGQVVKTENFKNLVPGEEVQINIDGLATGEYLMSFSNTQGSFTQKLIVK